MNQQILFVSNFIDEKSLPAIRYNTSWFRSVTDDNDTWIYPVQNLRYSVCKLKNDIHCAYGYDIIVIQ